jgi:histidine triad (HIT) family protein
MEGCIFCKIVNKEIPTTFVYENKHVVVFHDVQPQADVHLLVVPKKHIQDVYTMQKEDDRIFVEVHRAICDVAKNLNLLKSGFRIINNCGRGAGQSVFHVHFHVLSGKSVSEKLI